MPLASAVEPSSSLALDGPRGLRQLPSGTLSVLSRSEPWWVDAPAPSTSWGLRVTLCGAGSLAGLCCPHAQSEPQKEGQRRDLSPRSLAQGVCQASPAPPGPRGRLPAPESSTGHFRSAWAQSDPRVGFLQNRATCLKRWDGAFLVQVPGSLPAPHCTFLPFREPGCPLLICPPSHTQLEHVALIPSLAWGPYPHLSPTRRDGPACLLRVPQEGNGAGD